MSYSYDKFLRPITSSDRNIKILDDTNDIKYTIDPFVITNIAAINNILRISLKSLKVILLNFSSKNEAKVALIRLKEQIDALTTKVPILIDKDIQNYIDYQTSSQGTSGTSGINGIDGATGPGLTSLSTTSVNASLSLTSSLTLPSTSITIDDTNFLNYWFMAKQLFYMLPTDNGSYTLQRLIAANILKTGTVDVLSENPMGVQYTTSSTIGSVAARYGNPYTSASIAGRNFSFDISSRFRISTNNSTLRFFCGLSSQYASTAPTNVEPTTLINSIGVAKLRDTTNLYFIWNDNTGTASSLDLGSGFSGTDTTSVYRIRIYKIVGAAAINMELYKTASNGVVTMVSNNITSDYSTGSNLYPVTWISTNTASGVSFKDYGVIGVKNNLFSS